MFNNWLIGKIISPGIAIIFVVASILLELMYMKHQCLFMYSVHTKYLHAQYTEKKVCMHEDKNAYLFVIYKFIYEAHHMHHHSNNFYLLGQY